MFILFLLPVRAISLYQQRFIEFDEIKVLHVIRVQAFWLGYVINSNRNLKNVHKKTDFFKSLATIKRLALLDSLLRVF